MIWYGFWQKLFGGDEQIDFCAKIAAALIVCAQTRDANAKEKCAEAAAKLYKSKDDQKFFQLRAAQYLELCERSESSINHLIRRCDRLHTLYPSWIEIFTSEVIDIFRYAENPLQEHLIDYIESLKKPAPALVPKTAENTAADAAQNEVQNGAENGAVKIAANEAQNEVKTDTPDTQNHSS